MLLWHWAIIVAWIVGIIGNIIYWYHSKDWRIDQCFVTSILGPISLALAVVVWMPRLGQHLESWKKERHNPKPYRPVWPKVLPRPAVSQEPVDYRTPAKCVECGK